MAFFCFWHGLFCNLGPMRHTLSKSERLKSRKAIGELFAKGKSVRHQPLVLIYAPMELPEAVPTQIAVSVSKRRFKHAVDRNRVKRQIREAYRLNKELFNITSDKQYALAFVYIHHIKIPYAQINTAMQRCLADFSKQTKAVQ